MGRMCAANARRGAVVALGSGLMLAVAGTAWGHARLENGTARPDRDADLTLHVEVERPDAHNEQVVVELPAGVAGVRCTAEAGWSCSVAPAHDGAGGRITWARLAHEGHAEPAPHAQPADEGHEEEPPARETFRFTVHTPAEEGSYPLPVEQVYSTGEAVRWDGPADSPHPAPVLEVSG